MYVDNEMGKQKVDIVYRYNATIIFTKNPSTIHDSFFCIALLYQNTYQIWSILYNVNVIYSAAGINRVPTRNCDIGVCKLHD